LVLCALLAKSPRSLVTGEKLVAQELFEDGLEGVVRPVFPPSTHDLGSTIANRLLHPAGVTPFRLISDTTDDGALASHAISPGALRAFREGDAAGFLRDRAQALEAIISPFFERQAEWDRDDSPPVAAIAARRIAS
jgi:hypothetical protein